MAEPKSESTAAVMAVIEAEISAMHGFQITSQDGSQFRVWAGMLLTGRQTQRDPRASGRATGRWIVPSK